MKKYLPFLSFAVLLVACNSQPADTTTRTIQSAQAPTIDTAGLARFQQWKAQNELATANEAQQPTQPVAAAPVKTVTIVREVRVPQPLPKQKRIEEAPAPVSTKPESTKPTPDNSSTGTNGEVASKSESSNTAEAPGQKPAEAKKKGWSNTAKGAAIGGAGGAVLGAILNKKNPAAGAVIGGVLGAGVGYGIGKNKDKKTVQMQ